MKSKLNILKINTADLGGGAEGIALNLLREYSRRGHVCSMAVGSNFSRIPQVFAIPHNKFRNPWTASLYHWRKILLSRWGGKRGIGKLATLMLWSANPRSALKICQGWEDFDFPGTHHLLTLPPTIPDIIHGHNLHGGYFDLNALPALGRKVPFVLTLHDSWLLAGHCCHSLDCDRWILGCGQCPYLSLQETIHRDNSAANWRRKSEIYRHALFYIATPSNWLMQRVNSSILIPGIVDSRVIHNGVDVSIFQPGDRKKARLQLNLPADTKIILCLINGGLKNPWKDLPTARQAIGRASEQLAESKILLLILGEAAPTEQVGRAEIRYLPRIQSIPEVAAYYQASDLYMHPARQDTFPTTILEAMACALPVIASAVGGIPEQISDQETGLLVPAHDPEAIASAVVRLVGDDALGLRLGLAAAQSVLEKFNLEKMADNYLRWFAEILALWPWKKESPSC